MNTVVIGVIGADVHAVGNKIIDYVLTENGFNVVNIGVLSSQEDFINAAIETDAKAILVSSLYGHGELDCRYFKEKCEEAGLSHVKLYVGGNIVVGKQDADEVRATFKKMGFDRVYVPGQKIEDAISDLKEDLHIT
jgi:methylaspartate mutase sigma subunit